MLAWLFRALAPYDCLTCGREGELLCAWCRSEVCLPVPSRCFNCRRLTVDSAVCAACRKSVPLKQVWIASSYEGALKELLRRYKFERARDAVSLLATYLDETAPQLDSRLLITYIPTATSRVRERGYDHAKLLAEAFARRRRLRVLPLLYRTGQHRQVGATRSERRTQLQAAFRIRNSDKVPDASIVLIDDVVTTGASLTAAARVLKAAGAASISALSVAHKERNRA